MRARRWRIKFLDQARAMIQDRALIDRALVGDFAAVDRQRRIEQDRAGDPRRRPRRSREKLCKLLAKGFADTPVARREREVIERGGRIDQAAAVEIEND